MAENKDLELINVYQAPPLDRQYSEREFAVRWYGVMKDAEINLPAEAGPVPTPEAVAAAPTGAEPTPSATPAETPPAGQPAPAVAPLPLTLADTLSRLVGKPLPLNAAADAAFTAAAETAKHLLMGAKQAMLPQETPAGKQTRAGGAEEGHPILGAVTGAMADRAQGVYEFLVEGLMGALSIPFTAISAGLRQQIENQNPAALQTVVLEPGPASVVRNFTGQGNPLQPLGANPTEEARQRQAALNAPMTLGEALDLAVQNAPLWMPGVAAGARKGARVTSRALKEQLPNLMSERGAMGKPPRIHEATGLPLNNDGTVTLYHGTTAAGAAEIRRTGVLKSAGEPDVYLTTDPAGAGYGDTVVSVRVNPSKLLLDDEFPGGRRDFRIETGKPGGTVKVRLEPAGFPPEPGTPTTPVEGPRPLKLFHGSPDKTLTSISANPPVRQFDNATSALGAFFSVDKAEAQRYAGKGGRVYAADVTLSNPYEMEWSEFSKFQKPEKQADGSATPFTEAGLKARAEELTREAIALRTQLAAAGHDGIIVRNRSGVPVEIASFRDVALGEPPTMPTGEGPRPLNLERIDAPDAVKAVIKRLDELVNAGEPLRGHRERQTHAETIAMAKERGLNLERMMKQDPTTFLPDEAKQTALRDAHNAAAQVLDDLERRMAAGDPVARAEYTAAFGVAMKLGELDVAAGTNLARGLESRTIASKAERAQMQGMADLAAKIKNLSGVAPEELAAMRAHLNAAQEMTWMQALGASAAVTRDVLHTLWVQSLLTNPVTHTVNPFGTFAGLAWDAVAERPMAELVNRWLTRDPTGIAAGEALQAVSHPIEAMKDAVRLLGETWKTGQSPFERDTRTQGIGARLGLTGPAAEIGEATTAGKAGVPRINAEKYGWSPETLPGAFIDALGAGLDNPLLPTGWLRLEDAVPKGVAYRMEIGAQSVWQATAEMRAAEAAGTPMTPEQFAARVKDLQLTPTPAMVKAAGDHAVQITMNADLGPMGQRVTELANTAPFGRWLVPFIRWGGNAFSFAAQRLPVTGEISALVGKNRADIAAGGRLRDQAIARMIVGHGVALIIHQEVYSGNLTGSGAITQKMAGERPFRECPSYSMKIGGDCMPANYLRTLGQVGLLIAAVADHAELSREIPDQRWYDEWAAQASAIAMALGYTFVQQSAMQGLANVLEAIKDPVRKGNAIGLGFARSAIPAGVRQLTRVRDDNVIREVHSMTDALRSGLPWTVDGVAPKRHPITGAVRHMPAGYGWDLVSPVFWQNANTDPVDAAIIANDIGQGFVLPSSIGGSNNPGDIPRMTEPLPGEGVRLTPLERDRWIDHMTEDKVHGLTLHETLMATIQSERYKAGAPGPGGMRAFLITKEVQAFRKAGLIALLRDPRHPDLEARYEAAIRTKANALRPQADPRNPLNPQRNTLNPAQLLQSLGR